MMALVFELSEYNMDFLTRVNMKTCVLVDFIIELSPSDFLFLDGRVINLEAPFLKQTLSSSPI